MTELIHRFKNNYNNNYQHMTFSNITDEKLHVNEIIQAWQSFVNKQNLGDSACHHLCKPNSSEYKKYKSALDNFKSYINKNYQEPRKSDILDKLNTLYFDNEITGLYVNSGYIWLYSKKDLIALNELDLNINKHLQNIINSVDY